jgi:hypothetical protein
MDTGACVRACVRACACACAGDSDSGTGWSAMWRGAKMGAVGDSESVGQPVSRITLSPKGGAIVFPRLGAIGEAVMGLLCLPSERRPSDRGLGSLGRPKRAGCARRADGPPCPGSGATPRLMFSAAPLTGGGAARLVRRGSAALGGTLV